MGDISASGHQPDILRSTAERSTRLTGAAKRMGSAKMRMQLDPHDSRLSVAIKVGTASLNVFNRSAYVKLDQTTSNGLVIYVNRRSIKGRLGLEVSTPGGTLKFDTVRQRVGDYKQYLTAYANHPMLARSGIPRRAICIAYEAAMETTNLNHEILPAKGEFPTLTFEATREPKGKQLSVNFLKKLGQGSFGVVFERISTTRSVPSGLREAIKLPVIRDGEDTQVAIRNFTITNKREVALRNLTVPEELRLNGKPYSVVQDLTIRPGVHAVSSDTQLSGVGVLEMRVAEFGDAQHLLEAEAYKQLPAGMKLALAHDAMCQLATAERNNLCLTDRKPGNTLVEEHEGIMRAVLSDLGDGAEFRPDSEHLPHLVRTPFYTIHGIASKAQISKAGRDVAFEAYNMVNALREKGINIADFIDGGPPYSISVDMARQLDRAAGLPEGRVPSFGSKLASSDPNLLDSLANGRTLVQHFRFIGFKILQKDAVSQQAIATIEILTGNSDMVRRQPVKSKNGSETHLFVKGLSDNEQKELVGALKARGVPVELARVLSRALDENPVARPSAEVLATAIKAEIDKAPMSIEQKQKATAAFKKGLQRESAAKARDQALENLGL